jgi:hypothetical protein
VLRELRDSGQLDAVDRAERALGASTVETERLWPKLDTIAAWTEGASAPYARKLANRFPQASIEPRGLLATEGAITLRIDADDGCAPALTSAFIEFVDATGVARLSHELQTGEVYRVVTTTPGGLYRYDMQDELLCVGWSDAVPRLRFLGRAGLTSDLVGEKLTESFVSQSLARISLAISLVPAHVPKPHYELWVDEHRVAGHLEIARRADDLLMANPQYLYARESGQLGPIRVVHSRGFLQHRHDVLAGRGMRAGDMKASSLIVDRSTLPVAASNP